MKDNSETRHFIGYLHKHNITGVIIGVDSNKILGFVKSFVTNRRDRVKAGMLEVFNSDKGEFEPAVMLVEKVKFSFNFENMKKYWKSGGREIFIHRSRLPHRGTPYFVKENGALSDTLMQMHIRNYREANNGANHGRTNHGRTNHWIVPPGILGGEVWRQKRNEFNKS